MLQIKMLQTCLIKLLHTYRKKFIIPLDFEMLDSSAPYYQAGLVNRLCYELTFNDYNQVINATGQAPKPDVEYKISNISLEYEIVTQPTLAKHISDEYQNMALLYNRILKHKSDPIRNWSINMPCKSLRDILVLFEEEQPYVRDTSKFYNTKIQKVSVIVEGKPDELYTQGMTWFEQYDETRKYFTEGKQKDNNANEVQAQLQLHDLDVGEYLVNKYALWLDLRTTDENSLHETGRRIENASEGIILQIEKKPESSESLKSWMLS